MPADSMATEIGQNIRAEMGRRRVSMVELGRRTRIPRTTLAHQINVGQVSAANLVAIAAALEVAPTDLLPENQQATA